MDKYISKLARVVRQIRGLFPSAIPVGMTEFNTWADSIINTYDIPADADSIKWALSTMIMHSGPTDGYRAKFSFYLMLRASMAKQVAGAVFQELKTKQQEQLKAAEAAKQAESDVQSISN